MTPLGDEPIRSHRPWLGAFIVTYKKLVRLAIGPYLRTLFEIRDAQALRRKRELEAALGEARGELAALRKELTRHQTRLSLLETASRAEAPGEPEHLPRADERGLLDRHYVDFEDRFRGPRDEILRRQRHYVPILKAGLGSCGLTDGHVLDIGFGRGELLELLATHQVPARGIDANPENVIAARERGHAVDYGDALEHLRAMPEASLGGIVSCQMIEHLPVPALIELIELAHARLAEGAALILETVNPLSLYATRTFTLDLTHQRLIHPETLRFLLTAAGFASVDIQLLSPVPDEVQLDARGDPNLTKLNDFLFGYRDYAAIAHR